MTGAGGSKRYPNNNGDDDDNEVGVAVTQEAVTRDTCTIVLERMVFFLNTSFPP